MLVLFRILEVDCHASMTLPFTNVLVLLSILKLYRSISYDDAFPLAKEEVWV